MQLTRRTFLKGTAATLASIGLPAWAVEELVRKDQDFSLLQRLFQQTDGGAPDAAVHLLNRISYGPTASDLARVRQIGINAYIDEQLYPEKIDDSALEQRLAPFSTLNMSGADLLQQKGALVLRELQQATILRARYSRRQLQEVLVDFWSNHFNVFTGKSQCRFLKTLDDREAIRPRVLGKFRDLLGASAKSPAMLVFLDNRLNRKQAPNENYGRELMELHTISVDGGYTEADVEAVARCFTGWTIRDGKFFFAAAQHDQTAKTVLGATIPAGGGIEDGEQVLDLLARHPKTARFIATKLCRRFVADDPPTTLIDRVTATFQSTDGDIRQVVATILRSAEFAAARGQKFRRPNEYIIAAARALGAETDGQPLAQQLRQLGQPFFAAPMPPGYPDVTGAWLNTSGLLGRWNYALGLAGGKQSAVQVDLKPIIGEVTTADAVAQRIVAATLPGYAATDLPAYLARFLGGAQASAQQVQQRAPVAIGLLLAAPIFQRR